MKKSVIKGWIGKSEPTDKLIRWVDTTIVYARVPIYPTRLTAREWHPEDWPPKRVTIEITVDD